MINHGSIICWCLETLVLSRHALMSRLGQRKLFRACYLRAQAEHIEHIDRVFHLLLLDVGGSASLPAMAALHVAL